MARLFFWAKFYLILIFLITFVFICITGYILWSYSPELPSYEKIKKYQPNLSSRVYTSDGLLLEKFFVQERIFVPINRIPKKLVKAFLAAEDKNFYTHFGIDPIAIFRASITNLINKFTSRKLIGASTITQQVVKNLLLSSDISYERKIKEIILAIRIENILSKDQILELYLNDIYLGYGSYGVASASLNYFNKSLNELEIHEMAFLAALPKAPNNYNPLRKYKAAISRRNWVLDKMYENNFINSNELNYKNLPINIKNRFESNFDSADYFNEEIRKYLYNKYGKEKLYSDGLIIKTTIDTNLQSIADKVLIDGLLNYDKRQGWRGVLGNLNYSIASKNFNEEKFPNPFSDNWFLLQVTETKNNSLQTIDSQNNKYLVELTLEENSWLKNEIFRKGDIFL